MNKILVVDDDVSLASALASSFIKRGYLALIAGDLDGAKTIAAEQLPEFAVVDLRLNQSNGLEVTKELIAIRPDMKIVVLTGYASINTAVEAMKLGACHYLAKPANANDILDAFGASKGRTDVEITHRPSTIKNLEWERIQETLIDTNYNISETARRLGLHRRTLARKLQKQPVK
ncbi:MAG: response regulator transcription factor [Caulobacterales bacterium]|nr:response regulator transcription factor [Caulobacterales bacterium]MCA0373573.1 response regulator transcription factor [Pseudomonadota bacterium]